MRFHVRNQMHFFVVVVVAVVLVGLVLALLVGRQFQLSPVWERFGWPPASSVVREFAPPVVGHPGAVIPVAGGIARDDQLHLLARLVQAEAGGEPYVGKVAVGAVVLNRVRHGSFPNTIAGVVFQPRAFEPVANGRIWRAVKQDSYRAARQALAGWDPTHGSLYFWNPATARSPWVWSRSIITRIGKHIFAR